MSDLERIIARVFGLPESQVDDDTSNQTIPNWDSMGHMTLVMELESAYGVSLSIDEVLMMTDVASIRRILCRHGVH
ncbi:MAG: acyl carrier protein [Xanthomonadaceae bacterium]|nr:acyl carrier protein [Xanthomonadaceae bacterium]